MKRRGEVGAMRNRHFVVPSGGGRLGWLPAGDFIWVGLALAVVSPVWLFLLDAEVFRAVLLAGFAVLFLGLSFVYAKRAVSLVREDDWDPHEYLVRPGVLPSATWLTLAVITCYFCFR